MTTWQYKVIYTPATGMPLGNGSTHQERFEDGLNRLGVDGWELCDCPGLMLVFKRQLPRRLSQEAIDRARKEEPHAYRDGPNRDGRCWCGMSFSNPVHDPARRGG